MLIGVKFIITYVFVVKTLNRQLMQTTANMRMTILANLNQLLSGFKTLFTPVTHTRTHTHTSLGTSSNYTIELSRF